MATIFSNPAVDLKDILPKGAKAVYARIKIHGNSPAAGIFSPIFEAVRESGITRRDLKPANVEVACAGLHKLKLLDV